MNLNGGKVTAVPITKELQSHVTKSYQKYRERVEIEKDEARVLECKRKAMREQVEKEKEALKQNEERKRKFGQKEKEVKKTEEQLKSDLEKANHVFAEANKRLASAIKKKDFVELDIAQGLLEVAKTDMDKVTAAVESCREQRQDIDSKRQKMLDNYIYKQRSSVNSSMTRDKSGQKEK